MIITSPNPPSLLLAISADPSTISSYCWNSSFWGDRCTSWRRARSASPSPSRRNKWGHTGLQRGSSGASEHCNSLRWLLGNYDPIMFQILRCQCDMISAWPRMSLSRGRKKGGGPRLALQSALAGACLLRRSVAAASRQEHTFSPSRLGERCCGYSASLPNMWCRQPWLIPHSLKLSLIFPDDLLRRPRMRTGEKSITQAGRRPRMFMWMSIKWALIYGVLV